LERLAGQAVLADQRGRRAWRCRLLGAGEALDQLRQAVGLATADDPLEQPSVLVRDLELRVARADASRRVRETQQIAVRHACAAWVLHGLVGERLDRLGRVPATHRAAERTAPAAEALDEG